MRQNLVLTCMLTVALAGCGAGGTDAAMSEPDPAVVSAPAPIPTQAAAAPTSTPEAAEGIALKSAGSEFGPMLFDASGQAIYLFDKETTDRPECYDACAKAWPPVLTESAPRAQGEVAPALLGTTERSDGTTQVTYGGHPLYFYAHEAQNEVKCHNVRGFGGLWLVVTPTGNAAP